MSEPDASPVSWWSRNWPWLVGLGVPLGCLGALVIVVGALGLILAIVANLVKSSDVCEEALRRARSSPEVQRELGPPVEDRWWLLGSIEVSGPHGEADVSIPLRGSKRDGTLYLAARKQAGRWSYQVLEVEVEGKEERIDLRSSPPPVEPGSTSTAEE